MVLISYWRRTGRRKQAAAELGLDSGERCTSAIDAAIDAVIAANPKPLQDYKAGKQSAHGGAGGDGDEGGQGVERQDRAGPIEAETSVGWGIMGL
jgi:hypothetical protein